MAQINDFDDILNAMDADPRLAEALRERLLTRELMQLPVVVQGLSSRVDALSNRVEEISIRLDEVSKGLEAITDILLSLTSRVDALTETVLSLTSRVDALTENLQSLTGRVDVLTENLQQFISEQRATNERLDRTLEEMRISNEELRVSNRNTVTRMDRMEQDSNFLKNFSTKTEARMYVESVADDMGLTYVRTLTTKELMDMSEGHLTGAVRRSFIRADLVMEVVGNGEPGYAAVEVSYTTDTRDTTRAIRNAGYITRFTGAPCYAGIVGVRKDWESAALVDAGTVRWSEIEDWYRPESEGLS